MPGDIGQRYLFWTIDEMKISKFDKISAQKRVEIGLMQIKWYKKANVPLLSSRFKSQYTLYNFLKYTTAA